MEIQAPAANNDQWLPTSSRNARWWFATCHTITAMVGVGVLALPYAMGKLGWSPGLAILMLSHLITGYIGSRMVEMHEIVEGQQFSRYHELAQHVFGQKLGLYIVVPQQLIVKVTLCIVYLVYGAVLLMRFSDAVCHSCGESKITSYILIFASIHFVLCRLPNFNSIVGFSFVAAVMSVW